MKYLAHYRKAIAAGIGALVLSVGYALLIKSPGQVTEAEWYGALAAVAGAVFGPVASKPNAPKPAKRNQRGSTR